MKSKNLFDPILGKGICATHNDSVYQKERGSFDTLFSPTQTIILVIADVKEGKVPPFQHALYRKFEQNYLTVLPKIYRAISENLEKEGPRQFSSIEYLREHLRLILVNITEKPHSSIILRYQFLPDEFTWFVCLDNDFNVTSNFFGD